MSTIQSMADNDLQRRVQRELEWNSHIETSGIAVSVRDGIVTLAGSADSYAMKTAARAAAHQVSGVRDVVDEVVVRPGNPARSDQELARAVREALTWDVFVPDERIRSTVAQGWVTLEGDVDRGQQREDAVRCVERLHGVRGVDDRIEVRAEPLDPASIRASIEDALVRRAHRGAKRLQIGVVDGVVTLKGTVDSWAEKSTIGGLAAHTGGVRSLVNELVIDPFH